MTRAGFPLADRRRSDAHAACSHRFSGRGNRRACRCRVREGAACGVCEDFRYWRSDHGRGVATMAVLHIMATGGATFGFGEPREVADRPYRAGERSPAQKGRAAARRNRRDLRIPVDVRALVQQSRSRRSCLVVVAVVRCIPRVRCAELPCAAGDGNGDPARRRAILARRRALSTTVHDPW